MKASAATLCLCLLTVFESTVFLGTCSLANAKVTGLGEYLRQTLALSFRFCVIYYILKYNLEVSAIQSQLVWTSLNLEARATGIRTVAANLLDHKKRHIQTAVKWLGNVYGSSVGQFS